MKMHDDIYQKLLKRRGNREDCLIKSRMNKRWDEFVQRTLHACCAYHNENFVQLIYANKNF
jgi:hypothetical protein